MATATAVQGNRFSSSCTFQVKISKHCVLAWPYNWLNSHTKIASRIHFRLDALSSLPLISPRWLFLHSRQTPGADTAKTTTILIYSPLARSRGAALMNCSSCLAPQNRHYPFTLTPLSGQLGYVRAWCPPRGRDVTKNKMMVIRKVEVKINFSSVTNFPSSLFPNLPHFRSSSFQSLNVSFNCLLWCWPSSVIIVN